MDREEIVGIVIVSLSLVSWVVGYLFQIQFMIPISSFFAGAFITYVIQYRLQKKSESRRIRRDHAITMRNEIYGPIYRDVSIILEELKKPKPWGKLYLENLEDISDHYLFSIVKEGLRGQMLDIIDRSKEYDDIRRAKSLMLRDAIRRRIKEAHRLDVGEDDNPVWLRLHIGKNPVVTISVKECLFRQLPPSEFARAEQSKRGKDLPMKAGIGGVPATFNDVESLYHETLKEVVSDGIWLDELDQREHLLEKLGEFLRSIESLVNLEL